jgi:hypothetical protein
VPADYLQTELNTVCEFVRQHAGVAFDTSRTLARAKRGADDKLQLMEARVYFRDFYGRETSTLISVRLDVTEMDRLYLPVQTRRLIHAYSDFEACQADIRCVKLEEQLASKMKCLLQRRHVVDLFDFVFSTIVHPEFEVNRREVITTFFRKTIFGRSPGVVKGLFLDFPFAVFQELWDKFIVCPIKSRLSFGSVVAAFQQLVGQLFGDVPASTASAEFFPSALRNPIMQAGHTLTLLNVTYSGVPRKVEPYSIAYKVRKDGVAMEYFYGYDRTGGSSGPGIKTFVASGVEHIENTDEKFEPRFPVEITKAGEISGSMYFEAQSGPRSLLTGGLPPRPRSRRRSASTTDYRYTVQCPVCGKRFRRKKYSVRLKAHKDKYGNRCIGRTGHMV